MRFAVRAGTVGAVLGLLLGGGAPTATARPRLEQFPIPTPYTRPLYITAGPDGNLWFTEANLHQIGRVTPSGDFTEFPIPSSDADPTSITSGPDGNVWF